MKDYTGPRNLDEMVNYLNHIAGTARQMDGTLSSSYGHLSEVDMMLVSIHEYTPKVLENLKELIQKAPADQERFKKIYLSIIKKIEKEGESYIHTEKERMEKFIANESISKTKKGFFRLRSNILDAFIVKNEEEL